MTYSRDINIGKPRMIQAVDEQDFEPVVTVLKEAVTKIEEATEELKKVKTGVGLSTGTDLDEEKV